MRDTLRAALIQQTCSSDYDANMAATTSAIRRAADAGARLALLQELHSGPYFCQREETAAFDRAEPIPGPTTDRLAELAREREIIIVGSIFERRAAGIYHNTAVVLDADGSIAGRYRKMHVPDDPGFYEKFYFTPGDLGFNPIDTAAGRLGVLVCWDQWFPEAARLMALAGAELLVYPTAIGWSAEDDHEEQHRQRDAWMTVQRGHAIANGLPLLACNRVGVERDPLEPHKGITFWGSSFACGAQGEMLGQAPIDEPAELVVDIDLSRSENVRRIWPWFRDRRIDAYGDLLRRYRDWQLCDNR